MLFPSADGPPFMAQRAVLFDAFGTLVHPEPGWERLRRECLAVVHGTWTGRRIGFQQFFDQCEVARVAQADGSLRRPDHAMRFASALIHCGAPPEQALAWAPGAAERYHQLQQSLVHAYDQPHAPVRALREQGYRIGVVSNYAHGGVLRRALDRVGLLEMVDALVVSSDVGHLKPHPAIFEAALRALGAARESTVMVGDDVARDVIGARRVGMRAVWVPYPRCAPPRDAADADATVTSLAELPRVIPELH